MSVESIKNEVLHFLKQNSKDVRVLVIKGKWGIGKTFAWNAWSKEAANSNEISSTNYSYVSLFGVNSLEELKALIFMQAIPASWVGKDAAQRKALESKPDKLIQFLKGNRAAKVASSNFSTAKNIVSSFEMYGWLNVQDYLVCIDDFERKSKQLNARDVLGLLSTLKEQRNCKIVLILNDTELSEEDSIAYSSYREKIVDVDMAFVAETSDLVPLVFDKQSDKNFEAVLKYSNAFDIKNIRTLQRVKRYLTDLKDILDTHDETTRHLSIHSIVRLCARGWEGKRHMDPQGLPEKLFGAPDINLDHLFDSFVREGFFDSEKINNGLTSASRQISKDMQNKSRMTEWEAVWKKLHGSFSNNLNEIVEDFKNYFKKDAPLHHLDSATARLKALDENDAADDIIREFIEVGRKGGDPTYFYADASFGNIASDLENRLAAVGNEIELSKHANTNWTAELERIVNGDEQKPLTREDIKLLALIGEEDMYNFLKSQQLTNVTRDFLKVCLRPKSRGWYSEMEPQYNKISETMRRVLERLAHESKINSFRLRTLWQLIPFPSPEYSMRKDTV